MSHNTTPGFHFKANTNQLVIEGKEHMQKRGLASPDDGDAMVLTFAAPVFPPAKEEPDEDEGEFASYLSFGSSGGWDEHGKRLKLTRCASEDILIPHVAEWTSRE